MKTIASILYSVLLTIPAVAQTVAPISVPVPVPPLATATALAYWSPSTSPLTNITYTLVYGTNSGNYTAALFVGPATNCYVSNLTRGQTYYFSVAAVAGSLTAPYAAEVSWSAPAPLAPAGMVVVTNAGP